MSITHILVMTDWGPIFELDRNPPTKLDHISRTRELIAGDLCMPKGLPDGVSNCNPALTDDFRPTSRTCIRTDCFAAL